MRCGRICCRGRSARGRETMPPAAVSPSCQAQGGSTWCSVTKRKGGPEQPAPTPHLRLLAGTLGAALLGPAAFEGEHWRPDRESDRRRRTLHEESTSRPSAGCDEDANFRQAACNIQLCAHWHPWHALQAICQPEQRQFPGHNGLLSRSGAPPSAMLRQSGWWGATLQVYASHIQ